MGTIYGQKKNNDKNFNINALSKQYYAYAGQNISPGTFIEFVNNVATKSYFDTAEQRLVGPSYIQLNAQQLDDERIMLIYSRSLGTGGDTSDGFGCCMIVTITDSTLVAGPEYVLRASEIHEISSCVYDTDRVFIAFYDRGKSIVSTAQTLCTIAIVQGTTISFKTPGVLYEGGSLGTACAAFSSSAVGASVVRDNRTLYANKITINNDNFSIGTSVAQDTSVSGYNGVNNVRMAPYDSDYCLVIYNSSYSTAKYLVAYLANQNFAQYNYTTSLVSNGASYSQICKNNDSQIVLNYVDSSDYESTFQVLTKSGTGAMTKNTTYKYTSSQYTTVTSGNGITLLPIQENKCACLFLPYYYASGETTRYYQERFLAFISGTTFTFSVGFPEAGYSSSYATGVVDSQKNVTFFWQENPGEHAINCHIFNASGSDLTKKRMVTKYETQVKETTTNSCYGIAKTGGRGASIEPTNIVTNGDFETNLTGWTNPHASNGSAAIHNQGYEGNCMKVTVTSPTSAGGFYYRMNNLNFIQGHIYYAYCYCKGVSTNATSMYAHISIIDTTSSTRGNIVYMQTTDWTRSSIRWVATRSAQDDTLYLGLYTYAASSAGITAGMSTYFDNVRLYDLTAAYGAGNEPTLDWCDQNFPIFEQHQDLIEVYQPIQDFNLVTNGDFNNGTTGWSSQSYSDYTTLSLNSSGYEGNCLRITVAKVYSTSSTTSAPDLIRHNVELKANHIYYACGYYKGAATNHAQQLPQLRLETRLNNFVGYSSYGNGQETTWQKLSLYGTSNETIIGSIGLHIMMGYHNGDITQGMFLDYDNICVYDLTDIFGAGKEPTKEWCDANL